MKKYSFALILSAAMLFSSCSGNTAVSENTETVPPLGTTVLSESAETVSTAEITSAEAVSATEVQTSRKKTEETSPMPPEIEKYYVAESIIEIPLSYDGKEVYLDNACREVVDGLEYNDFPAKEDIAPAIEFVFENYFKGTSVWYMDDRGEQPCSLENLSFEEGLYMDFDNDGENESVIVISNNSEAPFTGDMTFVYIDKENGTALLEEYDYRYDRKEAHIYGLVYDDCVGLITQTAHGTAKGMSLYNYGSNGFNRAWSNCSVYPDGAAISSRGSFCSGENTPVRLIWDPDKKRYFGIGREKISYEELIEKVPETEILCAEIERIYKKEITSIETDGWLNFYFYMGDTYIGAYVTDSFISENAAKGVLRMETWRSYDADEILDYKAYAEKRGYDSDAVYGLFLTYAIADKRPAEKAEPLPL